MTYSDTICWLHLSDFHIGKDTYAQDKIFTHILDSVRQKVQEGFAPDMIFITGDIANKGDPTEYKRFTDNFFRPLLAASLCENRVFLIPGNHDVDRHKAQLATRYDALSVAPYLFDVSTTGAELRKSLLPRFDAYMRSAMSNLTPIKGNWLASPDGTYTHILSLHEHTVGILGLNTAWLSMGDEDRHRMSPGKFLVEEGLRKLEKCDTRIVLGHHPIDWFADDEVEPIRSLLGRHNVIYLHGHLHTTGGRRDEGGGHPFLPIQAGAAFQAREDERWVNQILWCELDYYRKHITVEPLKWSRRNRSWVTDTEAFPPLYQKNSTNKNRWYLPLPFSTKEANENAINEDVVYDMPQLPKEWLHIDKRFLERVKSRKAGEEQIVRFFDGSYPSWSVVLSPTLRPISMVNNLQATLENARLKEGPGVTALIGPGGEGKTTVLKQVVCNLVTTNTAWMVLWRDDDDYEESIDFVRKLPEVEGKTWLIVSDEASNIAGKVYATVLALYKSGRRDIQFLLCCRDTDWMAVRADGHSWRTFTMHYEKKLLCGLSEDDARRIVANWKQYGDQGLRQLYRLANASFDKAVNTLIDAARLNAPSEEGSFLGAMLEVRWGEGLKEHVRHILERLEKIEIPGGTLLEAFAYIAALHSKDAELITKEILALKLNLPSDQIKQRVIGPLGEEAPIGRSGKYILTRHVKIAQAAVDVLTQPPFNYDIEEKYIINLVRSVIHAHKLYPEAYQADIRKWRYLSSDIFNLRSRDRRNEEKYKNEKLAIRLARALIDEDPTDGHFVVNLAQLLWRADKPEQGAEVFRSPRKEVKKDRAYYFAWAVAEGRAGNHALDIWLSGVSLADSTATAMPDEERIRKSLAGLATAFAKLFDKCGNPLFIDACAAAAQFGLSLRLDDKTEATLREALGKCRKHGVQQDITSSLTFYRLVEGIEGAWKLREVDLQNIIRGDQLVFHYLERVFGLSS